MAAREHNFHAVAFVENLSLKDLAPAYPEARRSPHQLVYATGGESTAFVYPFGVIVFRDVGEPEREREVERLRRARPGLSTPVIREDLVVREDAGARPGMEGGVLVVDHLDPQRAGIVALPIAQSASMEYYEGIVEEMVTRTAGHVERLERDGTVSLRTRPLHRFIGQAVGTRTEALTVLHLLDKPEATWDDPAMDEIYDDLRSEFDLVDRFAALEAKLRAVQEALELILDVARDRRLVLLEVFVIVLIAVEIVLGLAKAL